MDTAANSVSARLNRILDSNFFAPHTSVAYRFQPAKQKIPLKVSTGKLQIEEAVIIDHARSRISIFALPALVLKQGVVEFLQRLIKGANIRNPVNVDAREAYAKLSVRDLEAINLRQNWAALRVIPRSLSGVVENKPLVALDLCSGLGDSSEILATYLPAGSSVLGLEFNANFVALAKQFYSQRPSATRMAFHTQSVLQRFADERGNLIPKESVDLVHSIGALAFHFNRSEMRRVLSHAKEVLRSGGWLIVDVRKSGELRRAMLQTISGMGFKHVKSATSCALDRTAQECFQKI